MNRILLVDDAPDIHLLLREVFEPDHILTSAYNLHEAQTLLRAEKYDLILLDVKLPDGDGFNFCASLFQNPLTKNIPVIFVTGKLDISDKAIGFSLGAEDYIVKPFSPLEVKLRCEARLKKYSMKRSQDVQIRYGSIRIETVTQRAYQASLGKERQLSLTPTGFKLLQYLISHPEQVFTRDQLISAVWGEGVNIVDRTIDTHVGALRRELKTSELEIRSVHGIGYQLVLRKLNRSTGNAA